MMLCASGEAAEKSIYDQKTTSLAGKDVDLADYKGKVVLFVNVASQCGYTKQYAQLQTLNEKYAKDGLVVIGVPCNQFGGQEPGGMQEIQKTCEKYHATFPMLAKVDVNGPNASPLYQDLKAQSPGDTGEVSWNFEKFLVDRNGVVVGRYKSAVKPESKELTDAIEKALAEKK